MTRTISSIPCHWDQSKIVVKVEERATHSYLGTKMEFHSWFQNKFKITALILSRFPNWFQMKSFKTEQIKISKYSTSFSPAKMVLPCRSIITIELCFLTAKYKINCRHWRTACLYLGPTNFFQLLGHMQRIFPKFTSKTFS